MRKLLSSKKMKPTVAAIFDIDGTLLDSNDAHARAFEQAFKEAGKPYPYTEIRHLIGMGGDKLIPTLSGIKEDSPVGKQIAERKKVIFFSEFLPTLKPFPKAKELIQTLEKQDIKIGIATSAKEVELKKFLKIIGIDKLPDARVSADEVKNSKPDPDVIQAALSKLGTPPDQTLMIGDTPYDIEAALKVGVKTIAFRSGGHWTDKDLSGAIAIYDSPMDLLSKLMESPFACKQKDHDK
ncbi:MAG: HAD family hydrolase [Bdellovibrionia bacterium]